MDLKVVGVEYYSVCSRFIAGKAGNPRFTKASLKIKYLKCTYLYFVNKKKKLFILWDSNEKCPYLLLFIIIINVIIYWYLANDI